MVTYWWYDPKPSRYLYFSGTAKAVTGMAAADERHSHFAIFEG